LIRAQRELERRGELPPYDTTPVHATGDRPLAKLVEAEEEVQRRRQGGA
jgi:hypothetical protein